MKIIIGSQSPRRKQILAGLFDEFEIIPPHTDESVIRGELPSDYSERIAAEKAMSIFRSLNSSGTNLIISCDTIVCIGDEILGKPENYNQAVSFLNKLSGKTHYVLSSLHILKTKGSSIEKTSSGTEKTAVTFLNINEAEIKNYLSITAYMDKAGAYAAQENGSMIIRDIEGSVTNVIGFPLRLFFRLIADSGNENILTN